MPNRLLWSSIPLVLSLGLGGCLSSSESSSSAPNSFPPLEENEFTDSSSGDTSNTCSNMAANELCVTVEVPRSLAGDSATSSRRNLYVVRPTSVEVKRIDGSQEIATLSIERRRDNSGSMIVTLNDYESMPADPDLILQARLSDGTVVRGPLSDIDQDVKLNPFSEYLVAEVLVGGQLSRDRIAAVKNCGALCLEQLVWPTLVDHIQDFEISISAEMNLAEAVNYLAGRVDMTGYVDSMLATMTPGTADNDVAAGETVNFNTVYFGLELNRRTLENGETSGQWGTRTSTTGSRSGNGGTVEVYPNLTLATFTALGLKVNSSIGVVPFSRGTVLYPEVSGFTAPDWQTNSHEFAPGSGLIQGDYFRTGRSPYQQVTQESDNRVWGWASNPYFFDGYLLGGESITGMLGSYFHSGKAIELVHNEGNRYDRLGTLEDLAVGAIEVNLEQLDVDDNPNGLDFTSFDGDYTAVSFGVKLGDDLTPVEAHVQVQGYTASPDPLQLILNATDEPGFDADWVIKRESDTGFISTADPGNVFSAIEIQNRQDEIYQNGAMEEAYYGRIEATGAVNGPGLGSAGANGELLAYTYQGTNGRGITIIGKNAAAGTIGGTYLLQGVAVEMTADASRLEQLNGSTLTVGGTNAELTLDPIVVEQTLIDGDRISDPFEGALENIDNLSVSTTTSGSRLAISEGATELKGFAIAGGDMLVLSVKDNETVGLVLGFRQND